MVGERLKLSATVLARLSLTPPPRKKLGRVDLLSLVSPSANHRSEGHWLAIVAAAVELVDKIDQLGRRNFAATPRRDNRSDLALRDPTIERGLTDPKKPRSLSPGDRRSYGLFEIGKNGFDLCAHVVVHFIGSTAQSDDAL